MRTCRTTNAWVFAAALLSLGAGRPVRAARDAHVRIDAPYAGSVDRALAGARHRLSRPGCQRVFSDFHDVDGRALHARLADLGTTGEEYLSELIFYDGSPGQRCRDAGTLAYTFPRSRVVFVCVATFARHARNDPFVTEAALIHESLHSLGLGENPPTSAAITARVMSRCRQ